MSKDLPRERGAPPPGQPQSWERGSYLGSPPPSQGHPGTTPHLLPKPCGADSPQGAPGPGYSGVLVQRRSRWWKMCAQHGISCSCPTPMPHLCRRTHHLLGAVTAPLVGPVQGELFVVHCVAGVEGAGQAGIRAVEDIEGGRYCDFHAPPWWHCGQSHKLVRTLCDRAGEGASLLHLARSGAGVMAAGWVPQG